ncbi:MAG: MFS transporter [Candidatus Harrisonbacteria bacterium]|nr:MFS transporter [Candidatus Harrisonbacteria bacterium]
MAAFLKKNKINDLVRFFILADLMVFSGWGLIDPLFSIFIIEKIPGATLITVGISTALYLVSRALIQLPIAHFIDATKNEKDDFLVMIFGLLVISGTSLAFIFVANIPQLFLLSCLRAIAFGMYNAGWYGIFARHLDKGKEAFDWSLDNSIIALSTGVSGLISGIIAETLGFSTLFIICSALSLLSAAILFYVPRIIFPNRSKKDIFLPRR